MNRIQQLTVSLLALSLAACGGGGGGGSSASSPSPAPTAPSPAPTPAPTPAPAPAPVAGSDPNTLVTSVPTYAFANQDLQTAYQTLNTGKSTCGYGLYAYNANLATAAVNHSNYIAQNVIATATADGHIEVAGLAGFTGATPEDRASYAGYGMFPTGEVVSHSSATDPATDGLALLLGTVYHSTGLMDSGAFDEGIGVSTSLVEGTYFVTIDVGNKQPYYQDIGPLDVATFPCGGQSISLKYQSFTSDETPNPLPNQNYVTNPVGQPILVDVQHGHTIAITGMTLTSAAGTSIAPVSILTGANDPNALLEANQAVFIPSTPLTVGTTYTVVVNGSNNGTAFSRTFSFSTTQ